MKKSHPESRKRRSHDRRKDRKYNFSSSRHDRHSKYDKHDKKYKSGHRSSPSPCEKIAHHKFHEKMSKEFTTNSYSPIIEIKRSYTPKQQKSPSSSSSSSSGKDEGHYEYKIGNLINGKYRIEKLLGDGTFGRVLECKNLNDRELYAIKVLKLLILGYKTCKKIHRISSDRG